MPDFSELYLQHRGRVFNVCYGMVHNREWAEDLTQETFLKAWKKRETFQGRAKFGTWLHRIAVNEVLMKLRRHRVELAQSKFPLDPTAFIVPEPSAKCTQAYEALDQLPDRWRDTTKLFFIDGLTHKEIGAKLGRTTAATKNIIHQASKRMRKNLGETR